MTRALENVTVALTEHRFAAELAKLFEKLGARVRSCPLVEEAPVQNREEIRNFIRKINSGSLDMMIFLTGVGARFLIAEAEEMGVKDEFLEALEKLTVVVRGPKPLAALRRAGVTVNISARAPTSEGVAETLSEQNLRGRQIGLQLYGTPNPVLCSALQAQGAEVHPISIYTYRSPSDQQSVATLIADIIERRIDVITFTSAPQVRSLFEVAEHLGRSGELTKALNDGTIVASIGEVTSKALQSNSVVPAIVPSESKMGSMANAVADYFRQRVR